MAPLGLIWRLNTILNYFCDQTDNNRTMMDEMMVSKHTSPLILKAIFFTM
jgi:hypothetical protein